MFPGIEGFHWTIGHVTFLGIFYVVVLMIAATAALALWRAVRDRRARRTETIAWKVNFHDLPALDRVCRHVFTGEFRQRFCDHELDCRQCRVHKRLLEKHPPREVHEEALVAGLHVPADRLYHRGHTWVRQEQDGTVTVGLDELAARLVGEPEAVELPAAGTGLAVNGTGWHLRRRGSDVRVLSPVDGEVIATGGPEAGWYLKLKPAGGKLDARHLLRPDEAVPWLRREIERLQASLSGGRLSTSLADGGVLVEDLSRAIPDQNWEAICGDVFLQV